MKRYYIVELDGRTTGRYYNTRVEAEAAATRRRVISGQQEWDVEVVWLYDEYADDDRPYTKVFK